MSDQGLEPPSRSDQDRIRTLHQVIDGLRDENQSLTAQVEKLQRERDELREANKSYNGREQTIIAAERQNEALRETLRAIQMGCHDCNASDVIRRLFAALSSPEREE